MFIRTGLTATAWTTPQVHQPADEASTLTLAELVAALGVALPAFLILTAYVIDALGFPIDPLWMLILLASEVAVILLWQWRARRRLHVRVERGSVAGFALVVVAVGAYIVWLAWPTLLPVNQSPDMIHHISLIDFIQQRHSLVHDSALGVYLGEFEAYTPGSHILAALVASWLGTTGLRVLHPVLALFVALKVGIIYNLILRLLPSERARVEFALAGTLLLLIPPEYLLRSFTAYYFYAQVMSESFAIAMLWASVVWHQQTGAEPLIFFALCGVAVVLTWPLWVIPPVLAFCLLLLARKDLRWRAKAQAILCALGPIAVIALSYLVGRTQQASAIVLAEGGVPVPSLELYGRPFLALMLIGFVVNVRNARVRPLIIFTIALLLQTAALFVLNSLQHVTTFYLTYNMFYLLLYPMALFGALALDTLWRLPERWLSAVRRVRWSKFAVLLPVMVLVMALRRDLPVHPYSAISEPVYEVGA